MSDDSKTIQPPGADVGRNAHIDLIELYKLYREKVVHEDLLVHNRMMWLLVPESFLLTTVGTVGVLLQRLMERDILLMLPFFSYYRIMLMGLSAVGLVLAVFCLGAIMRADKAISMLRRDWDEIWTGGNLTLGFECLPNLTGGGLVRRVLKVGQEGQLSYRPVKVKLSFPVVLPIFFVIFWAAMLAGLTFPNIVIWIAHHLPSLYMTSSIYRSGLLMDGI
jgi:hypothetical protein